MYVRGKRIKGHTYFYLVKSERHGKKVSQKVIGYLGKSGGGKRVNRTGSALSERIPVGLEALAHEARKYKSAEKFTEKMKIGIVLNHRTLPDILREPMNDLVKARRSGSFSEIDSAKKLVELNILALNQEQKGKPFAPLYRLDEKGRVVFNAVDINTMVKGYGTYEPQILGKKFSTITPKEAIELITKMEERIRQRDIAPLVGAEIIQLLEEIRSGQTLTDFYHQVKREMGES